MFLAYNLDILAEDDFRIAADDRAFQYGDGLFETVRYEAGRLWFWPDHFRRLTSGMAALHLNQPTSFTAESVHRTIWQLLQANGLLDQPARVKVQVWRQNGGLYTPANNDVNLLITTKASGPFAITEKAKIAIYDAFRVTPSPVSAFKTLNALPYVLAGLYKQQNDLDDVLLLNTLGYVAECVASNVFWLRGNTLYTPSLQTGCVDGIIRRQLLRAFSDAQEGLFLPAVLNSADAILATNSAGIQVFGKLDSPRMKRLLQICTEHDNPAKATPG